MHRRHFLRAAATLPLALKASPVGANSPLDDNQADRLRQVRVAEVAGFRHVCPRPKFVGKNSHLGDHGDRTSEECLRIRSDAGVEGIGIGRITPDEARRVLGLTLADLQPDIRSFGLSSRFSGNSRDVAPNIPRSRWRRTTGVRSWGCTCKRSWRGGSRIS